MDSKLYRLLRETSKCVKRYLKTGTFRIEIITSLIEVGKVEGAQKTIVYPNLTTSAVCNRTHYKENLFLRLINKAERFRREKKVARQYKKKEETS